MKKRLLKDLPILAFAIITICQMIWKLPAFDNPNIYYWGLAVCLLANAYSHYDNYATGSWRKSTMLFFVGLCCYNLIREFLRPTEIDWHEYWGFGVGVVFLMIQLSYQWRQKTSKKK